MQLYNFHVRGNIGTPLTVRRKSSEALIPRGRFKNYYLMEPKLHVIAVSAAVSSILLIKYLGHFGTTLHETFRVCDNIVDVYASVKFMLVENQIN